METSMAELCRQMSYEVKFDLAENSNRNIFFNTILQGLDFFLHIPSSWVKIRVTINYQLGESNEQRENKEQS